MKRKESEETPTSFTSLDLDPRLTAELIKLGYEEPTPIQRETIPPILAGRDLLGQAATGTGKTAAFALPMLHRLAGVPGPRVEPYALVLVPTRELAMQVAEAMHRYGRGLGVTVLPIYGGQAYAQQLRALKRGVDIVVATPGRALDHIRRNTLALHGVQTVVLDEADEMLDMGFAEDLEAILSATPATRQTLLFSATMPARITAIARRHLRDPVQIRIARETAKANVAPRVRQTAYIAPRAQKLAALCRVLDVEQPTSAIVFCRTRTEVDELTETLRGRGYAAEPLHGGMTQDQRDRVMKKLRSGAAELLLATDVAARGLDIDKLTHVINYDVPSAADAYVHRIGRVGRAGREGIAITIAEPREHRLLKNIEQITKQRIEVATLPTVADLRVKRLEITRASLREVLLAGDLDHVRVVVESLAEEFDVMDIAAAAVKLAHGSAGSGDDEEHIPAVEPPRERAPSRDKGDKKQRAGGEIRGAPTRASETRKAPPRVAKDTRGIVRLFIGAGRNLGIRPQDLVGAITGEAGIRGGEIGAIEIGDKFSIVEIPADIAPQVQEALRGTTIRGKKVTVRPEKQRF